MKTVFLMLFLALSPASAALAESLEDLTQLCLPPSDPAFCESSKQQFKENWPKAMAGDYQGQRNVAFCLKTGCDGGVAVRVVEACAWRMIILGSEARVDQSDMSNYFNDCGSLSETDIRDAYFIAERTFRQIYGKRIGPLPGQ